jgi:3-deoxy-manno-octulosonate cytidylyltransferase (CMP-KDO synthetase)
VSFRILIPARYASTRLPGKPLRLIAGRPMLRHVWERASAAGAVSVAVATDDERIASACRGFGAEVALTRVDHACGTDRLAEVAARAGWAAEEIVVNVQGDEPLLASENVAQVAALLEAEPWAELATLATPLTHLAEYLDPNVVKVVRDRKRRALYFSRAPIPWHSAHATAGPESASAWSGAHRHVGIYAYRVRSLLALARASASPLEQSERLEQLRALELGLAIAVDVALRAPGPGVDTEADLAAAERALALS